MAESEPTSIPSRRKLIILLVTSYYRSRECTGGQEPGRKGAGGGRKAGKQWDSQVGGIREKWRKLLHYLIMFCNRNGQKAVKKEGVTMERGRKQE